MHAYFPKNGRNVSAFLHINGDGCDIAVADAGATDLAASLTAVLKDDTELFKQVSDNESFRRSLTDTVFSITSGGEVAGSGAAANWSVK